ncbi:MULTISPECIES: peptide chain release factor N(5)-glutamine methyltransferase [Virgibacillus]|uniref:peptide chain release factor N(5)-glutamine methyltransferase n=1 Tax=Virgibacillus TaxID=84406 RepID=UPI0003888003|nr:MULTISPECIES: peptide chain release factor N(5)-glutamine methyltransferase [Virgibacillus]EQB38209.1 hypothetical protein M948_06430 [Virgibacillus sp. CM-4]MYL40915.1 peptide chain release factor N(5)-glutamine methyltransferase [Virgibacillus massiliensis]
MKAMKQYEVLNWASLFLEQHHREQRVAELLLQYHLNVSSSRFYTMMRDWIPEDVLVKYVEDIKQHATIGIPIQHLMGYAYFYGRKFYVTNHVLIPRPETEELVYHSISSTEGKSVDKLPVIVDAGTGSGVIAITLALELANAKIHATDLSKEALKVAKKNADDHQAAIHFHDGDFLQPLIDQQIHVDMIVSNPPYISIKEKMELADTVRDFDPELALFAEDEGLAAYIKLIDQSKQVLCKRGTIVFEIGHQQGPQVLKLLKESYPHSDVAIIKDINGKDRIVTAQL